MPPIITGRVLTLPQTNKDKELHLPKTPSRLHTTSTLIRRCLGRCKWCTTSTGMSHLLPTSTISGEDSKQPPTNSYRFGCPIKPLAVIPSSRTEWMRSYCPTSFSRPHLRSGRSRVSVCSLPPSCLTRSYYSTCVFYGSFSHCVPIHLCTPFYTQTDV